MNIWIINHYALPIDCAGGTRHYSLSKVLKNKGHNVFIIASSFDYLKRKENRLKKNELFRLQEEEGVPFFWVKTLPYKENSLRRVLNMLSFSINILFSRGISILGKPDVIIGSSPHLFAALAAEILSKRYKVPFILEVRDLWPQTLIDIGNFSANHPFILILEKIERYLYRKAQRIITLLPLAHLHIMDKGGQKDKIVWIPNGIDLSLVPQIKPLDFRKEKLVVMYAGAHGLANNLDILLEVALVFKQKGWQEVEFRFVGDGPEKPKLVKKASSLNLDNVFFEDPIPKKNIYEKLSQADILFFTLEDSVLFRFGISPNKLFDYMAVGRPIVFAANIVNNPVEESRGGIVVMPNDPVDVAEGIYKLVKMSPEDRWQMGLNNRKYIEEKYSIEYLASHFEKVINEVLNR